MPVKTYNNNNNNIIELNEVAYQHLKSMNTYNRLICAVDAFAQEVFLLLIEFRIKVSIGAPVILKRCIHTDKAMKGEPDLIGIHRIDHA